MPVRMRYAVIATLVALFGTVTLFAVSLDPLGANIPQRSCPQDWRRISEFALSVHDPMPVAIDPERVL